MIPLAALPLALLLAGPPAPAAPAAFEPSPGTAEVAARPDPLLAFLDRIAESAAGARRRPLTPGRKMSLLRSLDEKRVRVRTRREYIRRRLDKLERDLATLGTFEVRAAEVRRALEAAPAVPVGEPGATERRK